MHQGQLLIGAGEVGRDGFGAVSSDDLARNRASGVIPRFFTRHEKKLDGTYHEVEYLELLIPGDAKSSPCHLVDDRLRDRYAPTTRPSRRTVKLLRRHPCGSVARRE
jgi:hypothetical protein